MDRLSILAVCGSMIGLAWESGWVCSTDAAPGVVSGLLVPQGGPLIGLSVPSRMAQIACEQDGTIVEIPVAEGDSITKGQILFRLSSTLYELREKQLEAISNSDLAVEVARRSLAQAGRKARRLRELAANRVLSTSNLEDSEFDEELAVLQLRKAEFDRLRAKNELEQVREQLRQRTLRSPFAGVVTEIYKQPGEVAEKLKPVLEVVTLDPLWVEFECPVTRQQEFKVKGKVIVSPSTNPGDMRMAEIIYVSLKANPSSHTFLVRAAVPNKNYSWRMGLKMLVHQRESAKTPDGITPPRPGGK